MGQLSHQHWMGHRGRGSPLYVSYECDTLIVDSSPVFIPICKFDFLEQHTPVVVVQKKLKVNLVIYIADRKATSCI